MAYFPMFTELEGKPCLVVGGGRVALQKVTVLRDFGAKVTVTAPKIAPEIEALPDVICIRREFEKADLEDMVLAVAATDDKKQNHEIAQLCRRLGIPVNAVDQPKDCTFIFPSYIKKGSLVAAFSSGGKSPLMTQYLKSHMCGVMDDFAADMTELLGSMRERVKSSVKDEAKRKEVYRETLGIGLENGRLPTQEQIEAIIRKYAE